jgi:hypothetical protein
MSLVGKDDNEKLSNLGTKTYKEQGVWFLNAYYEKMDGQLQFPETLVDMTNYTKCIFLNRS